MSRQTGSKPLFKGGLRVMHPLDLIDVTQRRARWLAASMFTASPALHPVSSWLSLAFLLGGGLMVGAILGGTYILLTRYREEVQDDEHYSQMLERRETSRTELEDQTSARASLKVIRPMARSSNVVLPSNENAAASEYLDDMPLESQARYKRRLAENAIGNTTWTVAIEHLEWCVKHDPDDWEAHGRLGFCLSKTRDEQALGRIIQLYSRALMLMRDTTDNMRARYLIYRGAIYKRQHDFYRAMADFHAAGQYVLEKDEQDDLTYNMACIYAIRGEPGFAKALVERLVGTSYIGKVWEHMDDYFASLARDKDFLALITDSAETSTADQPEIVRLRVVR